MNVKGIGIDIVENSRFREDLNKRFLTEKEINFLETLKLEKQKINFCAGRWAGKESIIKASKKELIFSRISILNKETGEPYVEYDSIVRNDILISISHEENYTVAFSIILNEN